jgi:hypothetical protein
VQKQWIAMEHYRLHMAEEWPDSAYKRSTLAAIRSVLGNLSSDQALRVLPSCTVCRTRKRLTELTFAV